MPSAFIQRRRVAPAGCLVWLCVSSLLPCLSLAQQRNSSDTLAQASVLLKQNQPAQARTLYESLLQVQPESTAAQQGEVVASEQLALDARNSGNPDEALRILLSANRAAPHQPRLLFDLAVLEESLKLYWDADKTVTQLQALGATGNPQLPYLEARIKMDLGQLDAAEQDMRAYLKLSPRDASAYYGLGRILQLGQHPEQARVAYFTSLRLDPHQTESHYQLGELLLQQGQNDEAIAEYAKTLAGNPQHAGALSGTGMALFRLKKFAPAAVILRQAIAAAPSYQPAHYYLGLALARLGSKLESDRELALAASLAVADNRSNAQRLTLRPQASSIATAPQ